MVAVARRAVGGLLLRRRRPIVLRAPRPGRTCWWSRSADGADPDGRRGSSRGQVLARTFVVLTGDERGQAEFLDASESSTPPDRDQRLARRHRAVRGRPRARRHDHPVRPAAAARDRAPAGHRCARRGRSACSWRARPVAVTLIGALVGVWPGFWLGDGLAGAMRDEGSAARDLPGRSGVWPPVAAIAAVLVVSRVAAYVAGRRAGKRPTRRGPDRCRRAHAGHRVAARGGGARLRGGHGRVVRRRQVGHGRPSPRRSSPRP